MLGIAQSGEIEPSRTEGGRGCITKIWQPALRQSTLAFPPRAHINKRANDVSHHVLQKALAVMRTPQCAAPHDLEFADRAHRRFGLAL